MVGVGTARIVAGSPQTIADSVIALSLRRSQHTGEIIYGSLYNKPAYSACVCIGIGPQSQLLVWVDEVSKLSQRVRKAFHIQIYPINGMGNIDHLRQSPIRKRFHFLSSVSWGGLGTIYRLRMMHKDAQ